jgi:hypothetical protein
MPERCCRYCEQSFRPSIYRPEQKACSQSACQRHRRAEYHREKIRTDELYAETVTNSQNKWRQEHPDYGKQYRRQHPGAVKRNRELQQRRDQKRRLQNLAKNNVALDLKHFASEVWFFGPAASDLAKNNVASIKVFIYQPVARAAAASG